MIKNDLAKQFLINCWSKTVTKNHPIDFGKRYKKAESELNVSLIPLFYAKELDKLFIDSSDGTIKAEISWYGSLTEWISRNAQAVHSASSRTFLMVCAVLLMICNSTDLSELLH